VPPFQGQYFRRATQAAEARQGDDGSPGRARHIEEPTNHIAVNEPLPSAQVGRWNLHLRERILVDQLVFAGDVKERSGELQPLRHRRRGQVLRQQPRLEFVAIARRDASQGLVIAEERSQVPSWPAVKIVASDGEMTKLRIPER
jgi:hypothetical protein